MDKSPDAFRTISEVADLLETPAHVLRFWESRFPQIKPVKRAGGRRYYRPADVALLSGIRKLLHEDGMTIRGVQKILREQGVRHVTVLGGDEPDADTLLESALAENYPTVEDIMTLPQAEAAQIVALMDALRGRRGSSKPTDRQLGLFEDRPDGDAPPDDGGELSDEAEDTADDVHEIVALEDMVSLTDLALEAEPAVADPTDTVAEPVADLAVAPAPVIAEDDAAEVENIFADESDWPDAADGGFDPAEFTGPADDEATRAAVAAIRAPQQDTPPELASAQDHEPDAWPDHPSGDTPVPSDSPALFDAPQAVPTETPAIVRDTAMGTPVANRLRALPPGALLDHADQLSALGRRLADLRDRMAAAARGR